MNFFIEKINENINEEKVFQELANKINKNFNKKIMIEDIQKVVQELNRNIKRGENFYQIDSYGDDALIALNLLAINGGEKYKQISEIIIDDDVYCDNNDTFGNALGNVITQNKFIRYIGFSRPITHVPLKLGSALKENKNIERILFTFDTLNDAFTTGVDAFISDDNTILEYMWYGYEKIFSEDMLNYFLKKLNELNRPIKLLGLIGGKLEAKHVVQLLNTSTEKKIESLLLQCDLGEREYYSDTQRISNKETQGILGFKMVKNIYLKSLNLSNNMLRDDEINCLEFIESNGYIKTLDLSDNYIEKKGAYTLGKIIAKNKSLKILVFNSNQELGDVGIENFLNGLQNKLEDSNDISKNILGSLLKNKKSNDQNNNNYQHTTTLEEIYFSKCKISNKGVELLYDFFSHTISSINKFDLSGNLFDINTSKLSDLCCIPTKTKKITVIISPETIGSVVNLLQKIIEKKNNNQFVEIIFNNPTKEEKEKDLSYETLLILLKKNPNIGIKIEYVRSYISCNKSTDIKGKINKQSECNLSEHLLKIQSAYIKDNLRQQSINASMKQNNTNDKRKFNFFDLKIIPLNETKIYSDTMENI